VSATLGDTLLMLRGVTVHRAHREVLALDGLRLARGAVVALIGDNGAGKTTLLKVLAGLLRATQGEFVCDGDTMHATRAWRYCRGRYVYLHQSPYMFDCSVAENVAYGLRFHANARTSTVADALAWAELGALATRPARQLSLGEQQRVALTRARVLAPPLLLADEVTANMDAENRARTRVLFDDLRTRGTTVMVATHELKSNASSYDAIVRLADGRLATAA
jgi:tungstate transport system ATP-binding protein